MMKVVGCAGKDKETVRFSAKKKKKLSFTLPLMRCNTFLKHPSQEQLRRGLTKTHDPEKYSDCIKLFKGV